jgi:hypothetical protein
MARELDPADLSVLGANLDRLRARIARACERSGRPPGDVVLVAVTKYAGPALARGLLRLGQLDLGENRTAHLLELDKALRGEAPAPRWHMIGHLQRNKAKDVAGLLHALHSLDSPALLERLEALRPPDLPPLEAYLEVRLDPGETRSGIAPEALPGFLAGLPARARVRLVGLMGLPPHAGAEAARPHFRRLRALLAALPPGALAAPGLSMGMTEDLEVAVEEGATVVRVGRALLEGLSPEALL